MVGLEDLFNLDKVIVRTFPRLARWLKDKLLKGLSYLNRLMVSGKIGTTRFAKILVDQIISTLQYLDEVLFEEWKKEKKK